jgi:hypothetical protein
MAERLTFLSYSHKNALIAGRLKAHLEEFGLSVFLAHDDIVSGSEWEREILEKLKTCDLFLELHTEEFLHSPWCQQEVGIAVALEKKIIPLLPDDGSAEPQGFHARFQWFRIRMADLRESVRIFLVQIGFLQDVSNSEAEKLIRAFERSESWAEAGQIAQQFLQLESQLTPEQIARIANISTENPEISNSFAARDVLRPFFKRHARIIPRKCLEAFIEG